MFFCTPLFLSRIGFSDYTSKTCVFLLIGKELITYSSLCNKVINLFLPCAANIFLISWLSILSLISGLFVLWDVLTFFF